MFVLLIIGSPIVGVFLFALAVHYILKRASRLIPPET